MTQLLTRATRRSRYLFDWEAGDCLAAYQQSLAANSGQAATFSRAATATGLDAAGATRTFAHSEPNFEWDDLDGDGILTPTLLLGTSDRLYLDYNGRPALRTWYVEMNDKTATAAGSTRIIEIGNSGAATGFLNIRRSATGFDAVHDNGDGTAVTATVTVTIASGDRVELRLVVASTGAITLAVTKNNATEVVGSATGVNTFAAAWNQARISIGCDYAGANRATQGIHRVREAVGTQTRDYMRVG